MCRSCILTVHSGEPIKQDQTDGNVWDVWGEERYVRRVWRGTLTEGDLFEESGIDWRMVLKCMSQKSDGMALTGFIWLM